MPPRVGIVSQIHEEWRLTNSCTYHLKGPNQADQNKLTGIVFGLDAKKCSIRVGWRWNPVERLFELGVYAHDPRFTNGRLIVENLMKVESGQLFSVKIEKITEKTWCLGLEKEKYSNSYYLNLSSDADRGRIANFYFGGDETAPHRMDAYFRKL